MTTKARKLADLGNVYDDGALSNRNLIINGAMQVAQRGNLTGVTGSETYFVDRFFLSSTDEGTWSLSQEGDAPSGSGFAKSAKLEITTADGSIAENDYAQLRYKIENQDFKHLLKGTADAKKLTLSFWVKSSLAQDFPVRIRDNYSSTSRQAIKSFTVASANTWQKVTMTFDGDEGGDDFSGAVDTSGNIIVEWLLGAGSNFQGGTASGTWENFDNTKFGATDTFLTTVNSTFYITGVQLEVGDTATPFEHRSYGDELQRCQRYYWKRSSTSTDDGIMNMNAYSTNACYGVISFPTTMRSSPTFSFNEAGSSFRYYGNNSAQYISTGGLSVANASTASCEMLAVPSTSASQGSGGWLRFQSASQWIAYDAEL